MWWRLSALFTRGGWWLGPSITRGDPTQILLSSQGVHLVAFVFAEDCLHDVGFKLEDCTMVDLLSKYTIIMEVRAASNAFGIATGWSFPGAEIITDFLTPARTTKKWSCDHKAFLIWWISLFDSYLIQTVFPAHFYLISTAQHPEMDIPSRCRILHNIMKINLNIH